MVSDNGKRKSLVFRKQFREIKVQDFVEGKDRYHARGLKPVVAVLPVNPVTPPVTEAVGSFRSFGASGI